MVAYLLAPFVLGNGDICYPSLTYFQNRYLALGRHRNLDPVILFSWMDHNPNDQSYTANLTTEYLGLGPGYQILQPVSVRGEDPRTLVLNDTTLAVFTSTKLIWPVRMLITYIKVVSDTDNHLVTSADSFSNKMRLQVVQEIVIQPPSNPDHHQKNWGPFLHKNKLHFLTFEDSKFTVVTQVVSNETQTEYVPSFQSNHFKWDYGHLRGGTPARLIGKPSV